SAAGSGLQAFCWTRDNISASALQVRCKAYPSGCNGEEHFLSLIIRSREVRSSGSNETDLTRRDVLALTALGLVAGVSAVAVAAAPQGQLTWAVHVSLAPT